MTEQFCSYEAQTAEAARTGEWPDQLRAHLAGCAACRQTRTVAGFMLLAASSLGGHETPPDPTLIWLKAELTQRDERDRNERRTWLWSGALSGIAATVTAWAALEWVAPVIAGHAETFAIAGASIVLTLGILYFAVYRPLRP